MEPLEGPRYLELRGCTVDFAACVARWPDGERTLTPTETRLLRYLSLQEGRAVDRQELLKEVWGYRGGVVTRTVKTTMGRLRAKVERNPREPDHLLTVTGVGYRFADLAEQGGEPSVEEPRHTESSDDEPTRHNLPSVASELVGRDTELGKLRDQVQNGATLVTLVGTGGIGKSALMLRFGADEASRGGWREIRVADLSSCTRGEDVVRAVATALDARVSADDLNGGMQALAGVLKGRGAILLLLDDAERCAADLALVLSRWLDACPRAAFIVTSRELLRIAGEAAIPVGPLGLEGGLALFRQRVGATAEGYSDDSAVAPVVEQLDGIPLAIEMAAAWADLLGPDALLKRLAGQLDLLRSDRRDRPARHESLRATVASSWELLAENERAGLRELAVFAGAFGVEDAEAVLASGGSVLSLLRRLRERSLLRAEPMSDDDEPRFRLFRAVRDYAREQGADEAAALRHGTWLARWGATDTLRRLARQGGVDVDRLVIAREDLVTAARRAVVRTDASVAVPCARALSLLAELRGPALGDEVLLDRVSHIAGLADDQRAWLELERGQLLAALALPDQARRALDDSVKSSAAMSPRDRAVLLSRVAAVLLDRDPEEADELARGAVTAADQGDDDASSGLALAVQARIDHQLGRTAEAEEHLDRALALLRVAGEKRAEARALQDLASLHAERGRPLRA
ncbi:MAG: winged helix-turn-helix domain-containing protein, partial [Deltaproteobacteria bacterium]|nr:winged helix-turn-helix domain-containing protein [Deltaproteobacteria bacterium]